MEDAVLVAVDVPLLGDERHKNWAKVVASVDTSKSSGWAYEGDFVAVGGIQDLPAMPFGSAGGLVNRQIENRLFDTNPVCVQSPTDESAARQNDSARSYGQFRGSSTDIDFKPLVRPLSNLQNPLLRNVLDPFGAQPSFQGFLQA